jgi:hypothetical protein
MIAPENPPGFVVRTEAQKAAWDNGYRIERGIDGAWLRYCSTTAPGLIWIAGGTSPGSWPLSIDHSGVAAEIGTLPASHVPGPGLATFVFSTLAQVHAALTKRLKVKPFEGRPSLQHPEIDVEDIDTDDGANGRVSAQKSKGRVGFLLAALGPAARCRRVRNSNSISGAKFNYYTTN